MFGHLFSACEEAMRILLIANSRSVPVYVFYQVLFPQRIYRWNDTLVKRESESINDRTKVPMIGHLILFAEETRTVAKYTSLHTHVYCLPSYR